MIQGNVFALGLLFSVLKIRGYENLFLPWPHFEFLSFVLGVLSMCKIKIFYDWPPILDAESRRPNTKRIASTLCMQIWAWYVQSNFFT